MDCKNSQNTRLWASSTMFCTCGEFLGMSVAAGFTVFGNHLFQETTRVVERLIVMALMIFAGVIEGFSIGYFQWRVLHSVFLRLPSSSWLMATVTVAALRWFLGMLPSTLMQETKTELVQSPELSKCILALLAALLGAVLGTAFGGSQWIVLRRHAHTTRGGGLLPTP